ncbi:MAG TPA: DUF4350 domain-containing protein, partial [Longimicrobiales bacterium]
VMAVLAQFAAPDEQPSAFDPRPSTFHNSPNGARALYLTLEALDIPVARRLAALDAADSIVGPLALLAPLIPPEPAELEALDRWIRGGGTLLYVASPGDPTLDALGLRLTLSGVDDTVNAAARTGPPSTATPTGPHRWTEGAGPVRGFRWVFHDSSTVLNQGRARTLLRTDRGDAVVLTWRHGEGTVIAWSDPAPLTNRALRESGAALIFARAAAEFTAPERPLRFDEYHQGYRGAGNAATATLHFLRTAPAGHAALQLAVVGALLLLAAGWRFGAPIAPAPGHRRSPLEHVDALAELYRQAGARATARRLLLAQLARRLGRPAPRAADGAERLFAGLAGLRVGHDHVAAIRAEWQRGDRADLVALAREIDRLMNEVKRT